MSECLVRLLHPLMDGTCAQKVPLAFMLGSTRIAPMMKLTCQMSTSIRSSLSRPAASRHARLQTLGYPRLGDGGSPCLTTSSRSLEIDPRCPALPLNHPLHHGAMYAFSKEPPNGMSASSPGGSGNMTHALNQCDVLCD